VAVQSAQPNPAGVLDLICIRRSPLYNNGAKLTSQTTRPRLLRPGFA
jgi:hypothetical protein